ncbi:LacI family DNA-binding transcriptional regulator [[Mannheimia] succiniciproducens]|nr:LacI family DNA-binding transcriptional regulator [[Mannheimia] succiniciproducens]
MVSLKDVAKEAGVSLMTVSRALKSPDKLSPKTYKVVKEVIDRLGYVPNLAAQHIRGVAANTIGVLSLGTATTPFSVEILLGIEQTVRQHGWNSFVINTFENDSQAMEDAVEQMLSHRPSAIIIARNGLKNVSIPEKLRSFPLVLANCQTQDMAVAAYIPDDYQGQRVVVDRIVAKGYQRPLFLHIPKNYIATAKRRQAFEDAWANHSGQKPVQFFMRRDGEDYFEGAQPLIDYLEKPDPLPFDVIICGNDRIALVAYQLLLAKGYRIPEDVAVCAYDNMVGIAQLFIPPLTTVELPHYQMGQEAALHLIEGRKDRDIHQLPCPLIEGESC